MRRGASQSEVEQQAINEPGIDSDALDSENPCTPPLSSITATSALNDEASELIHLHTSAARRFRSIMRC
jgi:hypothetical protein